MTAYGIALGSNLGDRLSHLHAALGGLAQLGTVTAVSPVYQTAPVDCAEDAPLFLNAVLELSSPLPPEAVMEKLRELERGLGRPERRPWNSPRPIDLDILYAGDTVLETGGLTLPHPRLHQRRFVLQPLADIRPRLVLPGFTVPVRRLLDDLDSNEPPLTRFAKLEPTAGLVGRDDRLATFAAMKSAGRPIVCLTAGDYPTARLLDENGVDLILVGDSLGMVVLGYPDTVEVTLAEMAHHTRAVRRGVSRALMVADLPFETYLTPAQALSSAQILMQAGADAVKLEGGVNKVPQVRALREAGIPVVGHIGMLPQQVRDEGGYKKKGKTPDAAAALIADAAALDDAGAIAIVLEGMVAQVAAEVTKAVKCPTIGIGAGPDCDGQILVTADLVGAFPWFRPPFAQARGDVAGQIRQAVHAFSEEVKGFRVQGSGNG
ncbi:MAG: 3-methyl-2-oxobutanoate hydroxymethyltransferase [Verrucomicrobiales bacterium]|nr:3-methyl-2-oxobutanoate hydroxymethyltransferase [Verrucomicrobiales bacterium]